MPATSNTAILIFSRSARQEARAKGYSGNELKNEKIARQLILHTERAARLSGILVVKKYGNSQKGQLFGNRFANAIQEVFDLGYANVIALGTDSPGLNACIIKKISRLLESNEIVVGPSQDGGMYALGISKTIWNKCAFEQISWQTSAVQQGISNYALNRKCTEVVLEQLPDIDDRLSFFSWLSSEKSLALVKTIRAILVRIEQINESGIKTIVPCLFSSIARRGPPVAA